MRITYNDKLNKLLNPYLESLLKEKSSLEPETLTLFDLFMEDLDMGGRYGIFSEILEPRLEEIIREENIESIANLMDGRLNTLFRYMLGDEFAGLFHTYLQLEARCPHTIGYDRRAQRSAHPSNHLDHARDAWLQFLKLRATGFSVEAILKGGNTPEDTEEFSGYMNSSYWLAAQIAQGNEKVIEYLNQVLTSENNVHRLQRWYLHAIAISGHRPLLELEGSQVTGGSPPSYRGNDGRRMSRKLPLPVLHHLQQRTATFCLRQAKHRRMHRNRRTGQQRTDYQQVCRTDLEFPESSRNSPQYPAKQGYSRTLSGFVEHRIL